MLAPNSLAACYTQRQGYVSWVPPGPNDRSSLELGDDNSWTKGTFLAFCPLSTPLRPLIDPRACNSYNERHSFLQLLLFAFTAIWWGSGRGCWREGCPPGAIPSAKNPLT